MMHSPEVELTEILSNNFNGNGLVPLDIAPDTKNTTRGVHKFRILKILQFLVLPIVIPFRKAPCSSILMAHRHRPKNQWVINRSHYKQAKITFLYQLQFFFWPWHKVSHGGRIEGHMV